MPRKIVVQEFLTLDGVMQGPGAADEDTRGGFEHGGWQLPFYDEKVIEFMMKRYENADALLFGRRTYETFATYWSTLSGDNNPFVSEINRLKKYVVSRGLVDLSWASSELISGDALAAMRELKAADGKDILVLGSGNLVQALIANSLVDEYSLMIAPIKLGVGTRLFNDDSVVQRLELKESSVAGTGELLLRYAVS